MLILLWVAGLALPLSFFHESLSKPFVADVYLQEMEDAAGLRQDGIHVQLSEDASGMPQLVPSVREAESLDMLPGEYEQIKVNWPRHASFLPRAMTSNPAGTELLVADDFNLYVGALMESLPPAPPDVAKVPPASMEPAEGEPVPPALRGLLSASAPRGTVEINFHRATACQALEGQALRDVGIVCSQNSTSICRILVLTQRGRKIVECPFPEPVAEGSPWETALAPQQQSWDVSQDWLHVSESESVESLAANTRCFARADSPSKGGFRPDAAACAMLGTSAGRIVQMREALADSDKLIPLRILHQRSHPSGRGSLSLMNGRYLLTLWGKYSSISAFDARRGSLIKEWRLPTHIRWLMMSGGGSSLFLVGIRGNSHAGTAVVELFRFEMPPELRE